MVPKYNGIRGKARNITKSFAVKCRLLWSIIKQNTARSLYITIDIETSMHIYITHTHKSSTWNDECPTKAAEVAHQIQLVFRVGFWPLCKVMKLLAKMQAVCQSSCPHHQNWTKRFCMKQFLLDLFSVDQYSCHLIHWI